MCHIIYIHTICTMQEIYSNKAIVVPNAVTLKLEQSENVTLYIDRIRLIQIMPENVTLELVQNKNIVLYTDHQRLTQIITNLLNNAIKHTKQGFIRFGYEIKSSEVYFFVKDSGEGIPEDKLDTIFGRFVQLNDMSKGVGLGLAICKGLVEQMNGTIGVTSKLGNGSTFYFNLPITKKKDS